eukprot:2117204-Lingulodinium_polyedra.AAC.1
MWGGPLTHGALASPFLAMGHGPETGEAEWNLLMKNDLATCRLVCGRLVRDWEAAPAGRLRKSAGPDEVKHLFFISRAFLLAKRAVQEAVGDVAWAAHAPELEAKFFAKALDGQLAKMLEGWPLKQGRAFVDATEIPAMNAVVMLSEKTMEAATKKKSQELMKKVESATYEQLSTSLEDDAGKLKAFYADVGKKKSEWSDIVLNHRRRRYHQGRG